MALRVSGESGALPEWQLAWETVKKTNTRVNMFQYFHYALPETQSDKKPGQNFLLTNQLLNQVTDELKKLIG